jgi:hypothetical protein
MNGRSLLAVAAGMVWFVLAVLAIAYAERIKVHRTDIRPYQSPDSGRSRWLEVNLFHPANYDEEGKKKLRILRTISWAQLIPASILLWLFLTM